MTRIFAIETSCDETAAAVVADGRSLLANQVASQIEVHRRFGGIYPEVASRQHVLAIQTVVQDALDEAGLAWIGQADLLAVTHGPGLVGSLLVGVNTAKGLALTSGRPLIPVNHLEGHVYSNWIRVDGRARAAEDLFPTVVLIVSGGHTELVLMEGHCRYRCLGSTLDDAAGEAFDKVARLLGLGFPGGPAIQQVAASGDPQRFPLPRPLTQAQEHRFNFSFSGLKTAVLHLTRRLEQEGLDPRDPQVAGDIAASFQATVAEVLVAKTMDAVGAFRARQICICGGVSANQALRTLAHARAQEMGIPLYIPPLFLCTDNAAMIAAAAHYRATHTDILHSMDGMAMDVHANLPLA